MMHRKLDFRSDRGVALVAAIVVSAIVLALGIGALAVANMTNRVTSDDRAKTQSLHAAEAGVNRVMEQFALDFPGANSCTAGPSGAQQLTDAGETVALFEYEVGPVRADPDYPSDPTYSNWSAATCSSEDRRQIRGWGWVGDFREMRRLDVEVEVNLVGGFRFALFAGCPAGATTGCSGEISAHPNLTVNGDIYAENFDSNQPNYEVTGDTVTPGDVFTKPGARLNGDVTAGGNVTIANGGEVFGDIRAASSTSDVLLKSSNVRVEGNVQAGASVTTNGAEVTGSVIENEPSPVPPSETFPVFDVDDPSLPGPRTEFSSVAAANTFFADPAEEQIAGTYVVRTGSSESNPVLDLTTVRKVTGPTTIVAAQVSGRETPRIRFGGNWTTSATQQLAVVGMRPADEGNGIGITMRKSTLPNNLCSLFYTMGELDIEQKIDIRGALYATRILSQPNAEVSHCPDLVANQPPGFDFPIDPGDRYDVRLDEWRERPPEDPPSRP